MRADRAATAALCVSGLLVIMMMVWWAGAWGGADLRAVASDAVYVPVALIFSGLVLRVARHRRQDPRTRLAWQFIAASYVCQLIAHSTWFVEDVVLHSITYPAFADYWFLIFVPFMLVGLLLLPGERRTTRDRAKLTLDALIVGASSFMVLWYLVLGPIFASGATGSELFYSAALPVGDLLLVLALATVLLRRTSAMPVRVVAAAVGMFVVADIYYAWVQLHDGFVGGTWPDLFWMCGCFLLGLAAHRRHREMTEAGRPSRAARTAIGWLPYGAVGLAYALLAVLAGRESAYPLGGMIAGAVALTALVVARQMYALRENRDLAVTDPLTGLANRTLITERLARLAAEPLRDGKHTAVVMIDLDRFKPINDRYGHEAGDAVLLAVASALRGVIRAGDIAGRLGGDEFAVIMTLRDPGAAASIAARLVDSLRTPVIFEDQLLAIEASIGVAVRAKESISGETLLQHADIATAKAKRSGGFAVYSAELDTRARDAELRRAIENDELVVNFQPAVEMATGRVVAVEALVRWQHPTRGLLMPAAFVDLAEETGAIVPLGEWVLRAACREVARWRLEVPAAKDLLLSVNLSPRQAVQARLVDVVRDILRETGFPPENLILELTESVVLEPDAPTVTRLETLRDMGIRLAVDDFGTGYAALTYLRRLPVGILKIDRSYVTTIAEDPSAYAVAEAVVRLGAAFGVVVVAEGIETAAQAQALRAMGCRFGQGFHFYHPMSGDAAKRSLRELPSDRWGS